MSARHWDGELHGWAAADRASLDAMFRAHPPSVHGPSALHRNTTAASSPFDPRQILGAIAAITRSPLAADRHTLVPPSAVSAGALTNASMPSGERPFPPSLNGRQRFLLARSTPRQPRGGSKRTREWSAPADTGAVHAMTPVDSLWALSSLDVDPRRIVALLER